MPDVSAYDLWRQAGGGTSAYNQAEYQRLLREHGLVRDLAPGETAEPLPCGWPKTRRTAPNPLDDEPA